MCSLRACHARTLTVTATIFKRALTIAANITSATSQTWGEECISIHDFAAAYITGGVVPAGAPSCQDSVCQEGDQAEGQGETDRCHFFERYAEAKEEEV